MLRDQPSCPRATFSDKTFSGPSVLLNDCGKTSGVFYVDGFHTGMVAMTGQRTIGGQTFSNGEVVFGQRNKFLTNVASRFHTQSQKVPNARSKRPRNAVRLTELLGGGAHTLAAPVNEATMPAL